MLIALAFYHLSFIAISLVSDETSSDFNGLGKELLGGFVLAVAVAIAFAVIKMRLSDRKPPTKPISISPEKSD